MDSPYTLLDPFASTDHAATPMCALGVMIKAPRAGTVKTRLVPPLTHAEAAALNVCFLRDTTANINDAADELARVVDGEARAAGIAVYTPVGAESAFDELLPHGFTLLAQRGEAFGERLFHAVEDFLRLGFAACCLIDSDSPTLPRACLTRATQELARPGDRVVLGAADDGGYYLIGLKAAHRRLFDDIEWSTGHVLAQTIERAAEIDLDVALLPAWYDVDDAPTLARLCDELLAPAPNATDYAAGMLTRAYHAPHTRAFLADIIAREGRARVWPEVMANAQAATISSDAEAECAKAVS